MKYNDKDLTSFHDGSLDTATSDAILRDLQTDEVLAQRLMALDPAAKMVRDTFVQLAPASKPVLPSPSQVTAWKPIAIASSAAAAALAIWTVLPQSGQAWHRQVSAYQVLYTGQTISMIEPTQASLTEQFVALDEALSIDFGLANLVDIRGLDLLRAQLLGFEGAPLGQIVFADHLGRPIALCLMAGAGDATLKQAELSGLNTISWGSETHQFLLVGPVPEHELQAWAEALRPKV